MGNFISLVSLLLIVGSGFLTIYLVIDFFEYLKKYHTFVWQDLCFERLFGISYEDFFFYPIKPLKFIPFLLSEDDPEESPMAGYKKRIKFSFIGLLAVIFLNFLIRIIV
jgi:hypothetical protein